MRRQANRKDVTRRGTEKGGKQKTYNYCKGLSRNRAQIAKMKNECAVVEIV